MSYWIAIAFKTVRFEELVKELQDVAKIGPVRVFYWKEHQLLGVSTTTELSEYQRIDFQNGTDQDYDPMTWPNLPLFLNVIKEVERMADTEVFKEFPWCWEIGIDYARRSLIYKRVYSLLDLESWEMDQESKVYSTFSIKGL